MKTSFEVFLAVADTLSITRAADSLHVTQQCASDHIRRLEMEYRVQLFERKPRFRLTEAGETMLQSLQNIRNMERDLERNLQEISEGTKGSFTLGISTSRAPLILPAVLSRYYRQYPNVNISFIEEDTHFLENRLTKGSVDLFIGINTTSSPEYQIDTVIYDKIMLVASRRLLSQHFSDREIRDMAAGVDLSRMTEIPFALAQNVGKVTHAIWEYLNSNGIRLNMIYNVSDTRSQTNICITGICAALCPEMLLDTAYQHNRFCDPEDELLILPVQKFGSDLKVDVVTRKNALYPKYVREFIKIVKEELLIIDSKKGEPEYGII